MLICVLKKLEMQFVHFVFCYAEQYHKFKAYFIGRLAGLMFPN